MRSSRHFRNHLHSHGGCAFKVGALQPSPRFVRVTFTLVQFYHAVATRTQTNPVRGRLDVLSMCLVCRACSLLVSCWTFLETSFPVSLCCRHCHPHPVHGRSERASPRGVPSHSAAPRRLVNRRLASGSSSRRDAPVAAHPLCLQPIHDFRCLQRPSSSDPWNEKPPPG